MTTMIYFPWERERLRRWDNPDLTLMRGTGEVLVHEVNLKDRHGKRTNGFYTGDSLECRDSLSKLPARKYPGFNF